MRRGTAFSAIQDEPVQATDRDQNMQVDNNICSMNQMSYIRYKSKNINCPDVNRFNHELSEVQDYATLDRPRKM
jgi:hypothetical protein